MGRKGVEQAITALRFVFDRLLGKEPKYAMRCVPRGSRT